jgi:hypothetical protein
VPLGTSWGTVDITAGLNSLGFDVTLDPSIAPTYFYSSGAAFAFNLDFSGATISNVNFGTGTNFQIFNGGAISDTGSFNYGIGCTNCSIFGSLAGAPQSSHLTFQVSANGITLSDVHPNAHGFIVSSSVWQLLVDGACAVADQGEIASNAPIAAVPEPGTWALFLVGLMICAMFRRRQKQRRAA